MLKHDRLLRIELALYRRQHLLQLLGSDDVACLEGHAHGGGVLFARAQPSAQAAYVLGGHCGKGLLLLRRRRLRLRLRAQPLKLVGEVLGLLSQPGRGCRREINRLLEHQPQG